MSVIPPSTKIRAYIGTYTEGILHVPHDNIANSQGIYTALFDPMTGHFENLELAAKTPNPSFLAKHAKLPILYSVNECFMENFQCGGLSVFQIGLEGDLTLLDIFPTRGCAPCHLAIDPAGRFLLVSNYRDGRFVRFSLGQDGLPCDNPLVFQSQGKGIHEKRQEGPHAHSMAIDPLTDDILMVDLGTDTVYVRKFNERSNSYSNDARSDLKLSPGTGCRHLAFSRDAEALYVVGELDSSVSVFLRDENGILAGPIQSISTLPPDSDRIDTNTAAAILRHPSGQYIYVSNRGAGTVSVFRVDENHRLAYRGNCDVKCKTPRFCSLAPDAQYLVVCGQDAASIETFRVDRESGRLSSCDIFLQVDSPVCVVYV